MKIKNGDGEKVPTPQEISKQALEDRVAQLEEENALIWYELMKVGG